MVDKNNYDIYFSREPIPSSRKSFSNTPMLKQACIIPFKHVYLLKFNETEETKLEKIIEAHGFNFFTLLFFYNLFIVDGGPIVYHSGRLHRFGSDGL